MSEAPDKMPEEQAAQGDAGQTPEEGSLKSPPGVSILIDITRDKLEAGVTFRSVPQGPAFSADILRLAIEEKGIQFGLNNEILTLTEDKLEYDKRLLVAAGEKPVDGKDGQVVYLHPVVKPVKVSKGEKIADITPAEAGKEGTAVTGEKVLCLPARDALLPALENVELLDGKRLVAQVDGYLTRGDAFLKVTPFFVLEEMEDEYEAEVTVARRLNPGDFGPQELRAFLKEKGIVHGLLEADIDGIFSQPQDGLPVLVAHGVRPEDGKNGELKFYFETEIKPHMDDRGNVDFKELNLIQNVSKGDKLVEIVPPASGKEGCTVFGKSVPPSKGATATLPSSKNASLDPNDQSVILADIDGCVRLKGKAVEVEPVFIVKDDVNFAVGNIDFRGSVVVGKNVLSGFKVKADGDVEVNGVVEDAEIEAGGNVLVKMGFIGRGKGGITAGGEVRMLFCENETVTARGDILVGDYMMNSSVSTGGRLYATEKSGRVVGGEIFATRGVEARDIGNRNYVPTRIVAGTDRLTQEDIVRLKEHKEELSEKIRLMGSALKKYALLRLTRKPPTKEQEAQIALLVKVKKEKEQDRVEITQQIDNLVNRPKDLDNAVVIAHETFYPGVAVTIYEQSSSLAEPMKGLYFKYSENGLEPLPLDDKDAAPEAPAPEAPAPEAPAPPGE